MQPSKFNEHLGVMRQIKVFFLGHQAYSPLLHRQRAEKDLDRLAIIVEADTVDHKGLRGKRLALNLADQNR